MVGVSGRSVVVAMIERVSGNVIWDDWRRQGVVPARLLGNIVRAMAYERRK